MPRGLFNSIFSWMLRQRIGQIEHFQHAPEITQERSLMRLLIKARDTEWGRKYGYKDIRNIEDFKRNVPIVDYEDLQPWIERLMRGEQQLLWPEDIIWFAKSSGTTSAKSKFIPVSKSSLEDCHFKGGRDLMSLYCNNNPNTRVFSGRGLVMGGSHQVNKLNEKTKYGDVSAVMMQNMPLVAQFIRTPDLKIALMEDWEVKIEHMAEQTVQQNVTHIAGVPTWTLVLIQRLFEKTGLDNLAEIWPNLEVYIHGGVSFKPYRHHFAELIRKEGMHYVESYNASEGFFAIQDTLSGRDMLLMLDYGIFYEFIALDQMDCEQPETLQIGQLEKGKVYALVISTNAGLWRYRIGDTIRVNHTDPLRIQVAGRIKHFINAFGEELIVDNADAAIAVACEQTGAEISDYTAAPIYFESGSKGGHEWLIEFDKPPADLTLFTGILDSALQSVNSDYEAKRYKDMALQCRS